jgi:hypothetical protein
MRSHETNLRRNLQNPNLKRQKDHIAAAALASRVQWRGLSSA